MRSSVPVVVDHGLCAAASPSDDSREEGPGAFEPCGGVAAPIVGEPPASAVALARVAPLGHLPRIDVRRYIYVRRSERSQMTVVEAVACCAPLAATVMSDEEAEATAELFRALGDPARVRILNLLATSEEPVCACHLYEPLGLAQPTVSHHLKKLVDAGLLDREQRSKWAYYSLRRDAVETLAVVADLKGACC
jgi:ArsR family transcriptional regulator